MTDWNATLAERKATDWNAAFAERKATIERCSHAAKGDNKTRQLLFACFVFAFSICFTFTSISQAQPSGDEIISGLKPVLESQVVAVLHIDLERVSDDSIMQPIVNSLAESETRLESLKAFFAHHNSTLAALKDAGAQRVDVLIKMGTLAPADFLFRISCDGEKATEKVTALMQKDARYFLGFPIEVTTKDGFVYLKSYSNSRWAQRVVAQGSGLILHDEAFLTRLAEGLDQGDKAPIRFAFALTGDQKRALIESDPATFAGGESRAAASIENLTTLSFAYNPGEQFQLNVNASSPEAATAMAGLFGKTIMRMSQRTSLKEKLPKFSDWLGGVSQQLNVTGSTATLQLRGESLTAAMRGLEEPLSQIVTKEQNRQTISKLRHLSDVLESYRDDHGTYPPAYSVDGDGKPLLSWRVLILLYVDRESYKRFNLNEPWDSEANKLANAQMPWLYRDHLDPTGAQATTRFQCIAGEQSLMNRKGRPFGKLVDSGRRTIAFVQVARKHAVPWSKPADFDNDQPDLLARLAGDSSGFFAGLADKRIIYLPKTIDVDALKNAMRAELDASEQQFNDRAQLYAVFTDIASNDKMEDANYDPVSELPLYLFEDLIARFAIVGAL